MRYFKRFRRKVKAPFKAAWAALRNEEQVKVQATFDGSVLTSIQFLSKLKLEQFLIVPSSRMVFPKYEAPEISILVVLYNKAEYTYQCLETLLANTNVAYELIIVDNCSTDHTSLLLERLENVNIIRNTTNKGFLLACNQAAKQARGKWLLFLNNDTQCPPDLLTTLLQTGKSQERCGAVGAKLILPDGSLQEAGSIIWKDGSCLGYGRGDNPDKPQYSYLREVDYCSGACLLVRSDLFLQIGGFDERFIPAYYEESDLCMSLRKMGYKVLYQPAAHLVHYEFGSSSSAAAACLLQEKNKKVFVEKWKQQLAGHHSNNPENIIKARERLGKKKRLLIIDDRIPDSTMGSGYPRCHDIVYLIHDLGYAITFFPLGFDHRPEPCAYNLQNKSVEAFYGPTSSDFETFFKARKDLYDAVWISRPHNMSRAIGTIKHLKPDQKIIYDAEAFFAAREILKADLLGQPISASSQKQLINDEIALMHQAKAIVTVSERERQIFEGYDCNNLNVIGHAYSIAPTEMTFDQRRDLLFVGSFLGSPSPNEDAILYFCKEILPLVQKVLKVKLWIVGTYKLDSIKNLACEDIVVTGRVDDLRPFYNQSRVFVVPTRYAAGIPFKLQEAMAHGIPTVVSPLIAEQLGPQGAILLVGDNPQDFAQKIIQCYTQQATWTSVRDNALRYIKNECSPEAYRKKIQTLIESVVG